MAYPGKRLPSAGWLSQLLRYEGDSGLLRWVKARGRQPAGAIAGSLNSEGYVRVKIDGADHRAHRIAWAMVHGEWPAAEIDHIDGNRANNRLENLRLATPSQNRANTPIRSDNTTGFKGVTWHAIGGRWQARATIAGTMKHLGLFDAPEDAAKAYDAAAFEHYGAYARLNFNPTA